MKISERFIISGISGVGKDFTLEQIRDSNELLFEEINAGRFIASAFKRYREKTREESISVAFRKIGEKISNQEGTALNCHMVYGLYPELFSNQDRLIKIPHDKIIVVEKDPEIILHQRQGDVKRTRPAQTIDEIHNMQKISTEIARRVSEESNAKIKIFSPENETVAEVIDFLKY
jgi:hypothetical protein